MRTTKHLKKIVKVALFLLIMMICPRENAVLRTRTYKKYRLVKISSFVVFLPQIDFILVDVQANLYNELLLIVFKQ